MPDGYGNDAFQWKNSSHRTYSIGIGVNNTNVDDDTARNTVTNQALLSAEQKAKLEDIVCDFYEHFDTMVTVSNRDEIRDRATCFWTYAKEELYDLIYAETADIIDDERRKLEEQLCSKITTLNSIGGSTRSCFAQTIIGKTLSENSVALASLKSQSNIEARKLEAATIDAAFARSYQAFIEGDNADFNKYMTALQLLRGACVDESVDDTINRDINTLAISGQYNRTAGDISDTADTYVGDQDAIAAAGAALG